MRETANYTITNPDERMKEIINNVDQKINKK